MEAKSEGDYEFHDILGFCRACEWIQFDDGTYDGEAQEWICPKCGEFMVRRSRMDAGLAATVRFITWARNVNKKGLGGPSPGGAAGELGCSRSMVDKLVDMGILERVEYGEDGHKVVMISARSIERAKKAKKNEGKWTEGG